MVKFPATYSWFGKTYHLEKGNLTKSQAYHTAALLRQKSRYIKARVLTVNLPDNRKTYGVYTRYETPRRKKQ